MWNFSIQFFSDIYPCYTASAGWMFMLLAPTSSQHPGMHTAVARRWDGRIIISQDVFCRRLAQLPFWLRSQTISGAQNDLFSAKLIDPLGRALLLFVFLR